MKRIKFAVVLLTFLMLLSGCAGQEPNDISYIVAIGIDKGETGKYKITLQYASPPEISGGEEINLEKSGIRNLTVEGEDIYEAVGKANLHDSKTTFLSHTQVIIFSREVAEEGIEKMSELFINSEELRPDIYLAVAENAEKYLTSINPETEINPARYYKLFFDAEKLTGLPQSTQKNFFCGIESGAYDTLLPIVSVEPDKFESAAFHGGRMTGVLNEQETGFYKFLDRDFAGGYITLVNDTDLKEPVTLKISQLKTPHYNIDDENKKITINLSLEGDIYSAPPEYDIENSIEEFKKSCSKHIEGECEKLIKKLITDYKSDILRLNEYAKMMFWNNEDYYNFKNSVDYSKFDIKVNVDLDVRTRGVVQRSD